MTNITEEKEYLSKEKYEELKKELEHLLTVKRKEIALELEHAKSFGDLKENSEYHQAREDQATVEDRINNLETLLESAKIVTHKKKDTVEVGSCVKIQKKGSATEKEYTVVGSEEVDSSAGKISNKSPIGEALMGAKVGDELTVDTPSGKATYKILSVR